LKENEKHLQIMSTGYPSFLYL